MLIKPYYGGRPPILRCITNPYCMQNVSAHDKYDIQCLLGRGGMGSVYLAFDTVLERHVAIKKLNHKFLETELKNRLHREAKLLAKLNNPNIVQVYDYIESDQDIAIVMEYVDGETLTSIQKRQCYSSNQALHWLIQIVDGLLCAHKGGVIHRDLKTDNIMLNQHHQIKIADFGIARSHSDPHTIHHHLHGSYSSLSPEQALGQPVSQQTDVFALGLLMYNLFANKHPFGDISAPAKFMQHLIIGEFEPLEHACPTLATSLIVLNHALLKANPQERPHNLNEVKNTLCEALEPFEPSAVNNDTLPLKPSTPINSFSSKQNTDKKTHNNKTQTKSQAKSISQKILFLALLIFMLCAASLGTQYYWPEPHRYVAVLTPAINKSNPLTKKQQLYLLASIRDALEQGVINTKKLSLINIQKRGENQEDKIKIAKASGADTFISTELICEKERCDIQLQRIQLSMHTILDQKVQDNTKNTYSFHSVLVQQKIWPILIDTQYLTITHDLPSYLHSLFPEYKQKQDTRTQSLSEEAYLWLLEMRYQVLNEGQETHINWEQLLNAADQYRDYAPYYQLFIHLSQHLYIDTLEDHYLNVAYQQLRKAQNTLGLSVWLVEAYFRIALRLKQFDKAQLWLEKMSTMKTDKATQLHNTALLANYRGEYQRANTYYQQAIALRPNIKLWQDKAVNHWESGDNQSAIQALQEVFLLDSSSYDALVFIAEIYLSSGQLNEAIQQYSKVIDINPQAHHFNNLGLAYELKGEYTLAYQAFLNAIKYAPKNTSVIINLADTLQLLNKKDEAQEYYQKVLTLNKNKTDDDSLLITALAHIQLDNKTKSLDAIALALRKDPNNPEVLFNAALIYSLADQGDVAITYIKQSLAQGLHPIWINLPWFNTLCDTHSAEINNIKKDFFTDTFC